MNNILALYLRLSLDDDGNDVSNSIISQRDMLRRYVSENPGFAGCEVMEFVDDGWSGTNFDRPNVRKLLDMARCGDIRCIIVKDLSRWGRNYIEVTEYIEQIFPFLGIRFISINDSYDSDDYRGVTAPTDVAFNAIVHDIYCRELSMKVRQSYVSKAKKGEFLCGAAPFGFVKSATEKNMLVIDEDAASTVRRIFSMACDGMSTMRIAAALNGEGVDTPHQYRMRKGKPLRGDISAMHGNGMWTDKNIRSILIDERYIGVQVSGKTRKPKPGSRKVVCLPESEWIRVPGAHDAIVTEKVFARANAGIVRYKHTGTTPKSHALFAWKIRCGHCGHALRHYYTKTPYYRCDGARLDIGAGCCDEKFFVENLKSIVLAAVKAEAKKIFDNRRKQKQLVCDLPGKASCKEMLKQTAAQIALLERRGVSLYEEYADGKLDRDRYLAAKTDCADKLSQLHARAEHLSAREDINADLIEESGDIPLLQQVLNADDITGEILSLIDNILVYDSGRIEIKMAFGDKNTMIG